MFKRESFLNFMRLLQEVARQDAAGEVDEEALKQNEPKMEALEKILLEHFKKYFEQRTSTRAIVFSHLRDR